MTGDKERGRREPHRGTPPRRPAEAGRRRHHLRRPHQNPCRVSRPHRPSRRRPAGPRHRGRRARRDPRPSTPTATTSSSPRRCGPAASSCRSTCAGASPRSPSPWSRSTPECSSSTTRSPATSTASATAHASLEHGGPRRRRRDPRRHARLRGADRATSRSRTPYRSGDDLAGVFYTGGTTGRSKGVMLSHDNLLTSAMGTLATEHSLSVDGSYLHAAPMFHLADLAAWTGSGRPRRHARHRSRCSSRSPSSPRSRSTR